MENQKRMPVTLGPQAGHSLSVVGDTYRILVGGKETGGAFAAIDMLIPPGGGPGPHAHPDFEESFFVVDGEIEVRSEAGTYVAQKGSFVNIPKGGLIHSFKNKTGHNAHLLCTVVPAGLELFFEEIGKPVAPGEFLPLPEIDDEAARKLQEIAQRHGQRVYPPDALG
ncbi:cupin domain-containing protein [Pedobacter yulinensis]|uniref:Cupin domain-containing protein n=1 Tax=Pedobacter yulinensis TaxID=2126353 RepID=A0A2T3HR62_9SPHI|nr:cupin domain-containing protein [Pedobacter yulinensis]PST84950.1 cupin domain-containing protein [Pedobacter yulinensis]